MRDPPVGTEALLEARLRRGPHIRRNRTRCEELGVTALTSTAVLLRMVGLPEEVDTPALRYVGQFFGIRNAVLCMLLWEALKDPAQLERMASQRRPRRSQ